MLPPIAAHLVCLLLVGSDVLLRGLRTRVCLRGFGRQLGLGRVLELNLWSEAAANLSPLRFAGEPVRVAGMLHAGAPIAASVLTSATEGTVNAAAILLLGTLLLGCFAPEWWAEVAPVFGAHLRIAVPLLLVIGVSVPAALWFLRRARQPGSAGRHPWRERIASLVQRWSELPRSVLVRVFLLSVLSVAARTLLLPVLAMGQPSPAGFGILWLGSYLLVYSQLALPVPAGAGAVELAFLAGIAGDPGSAPAALLVGWRFYSAGIATGLGCALAVHRFGARPLWKLVRGGTPAMEVLQRTEPASGRSSEASRSGLAT